MNLSSYKIAHQEDKLEHEYFFSNYLQQIFVIQKVNNLY
jgi:pterin-4a-carbinolamine dehydratase